METLIVPRKTIYFEPRDGRLITLTNNFPESLKQPMARNPNGYVKGLESGYRSGIITVDNVDYRIKGCRPNGKTIEGEPHGSQFLDTAQYEAERTQEIREIFLREGHYYPSEPVGFWVYDDVSVKDKPTVATLYKIKGDTRLDEFFWWLEKDLVFSHIPENHRDAVVRTFEIFGAMVGRLIRILHNHKYSWNCPNTRGNNAHPGNIVVFPENGKINFGLVDLDNSWRYDFDAESKLMKETQKGDLSNFIGMMSYHAITSGSSSRTLTHIARRMFRYFARKLDDLEFQWDEKDIDLNSFEFEDKLTENTIIGNFSVALNAGYQKPDMFIPEISLQEVKEFRNYVKTIGNLYRSKIRKDLSIKVNQITEKRKQKMIEEEQRKGRHWRWIDDGYGFSDKSLIRVMFDDWIPRIRVYADHTEYCLEGISPKFGMIEPDKQGFNKSNVFLGETIPMTADEITFHLGEVSEALKWWDSDMKTRDENNVLDILNNLFPTREYMVELYKEVFNYGIERSQLTDKDKTRLRELVEALN